LYGKHVECRVQRPFDRVHGSGWVRVPPAGVAATGRTAADVDEVLYSET
jgi:hypothetical protein